MSGKPYKILLAFIAVALFTGVSFTQRELVKEREQLGLTRFTELKGAPPVLSLTTMALGGFRGLISNMLWIRMSDLQDNDKYFEMVQLADWITKLEPHFPQVWVHQAWNMAYNISVKFKDPQDRWRWLKSGIELLRDQGLQYNPDDVLIHRELAWFFQHKMGANLDDAHWYYKQMWANEMSQVFKTNSPNWDALINPKTVDEKQRAEILRDKYKMDPVFMKEVDDKYGPLEWRLPEAHAIYWGAQGLAVANKDGRRIKPEDLIMLRRVIYQSMQLSFQRGRMIADNPERRFELAPNLDIIPKVNAAYEQEMENDPKNRDHIETAHRNFLRDAVYWLYEYDKMGDAIRWYKYLAEKYPNKSLLERQPNSFPRNLSLEDFAIGRIEEEVGSPGQDRVRAVIEGLETQSFRSLAIGDDDHAAGLDLLAQKIWQKYESKIAVGAQASERLEIFTIKEIKREVLQRLLNGGLAPELAAVLATKTGQKWPPEKPKENPAIIPPPPSAPGNTNAATTNSAPPAGQ
jgi:hypothetical protein